MLPINRSDSALYAEIYSRLKITGTQFLAFRDIPQLVSKYVSGNITLDYGCGTGKSTSYLKSIGLQVDGVDINEKMINYVKTVDPKGMYRVIKNGKILTENEHYDFVFSSWVLMEIGNKQELVNTLREITRVLKTGGTFITIVRNKDAYNTDWLSENTEFEQNKNLKSGCVVKILFKEINLSLYDYFWSDEDYREAISQAGLSIKQIHYPVGKDEDGYPWITEKIKSPCTIYVAQKL
ncbi:hypothetical protein PGB90_004276 [Kerria lacca]